MRIAYVVPRVIRHFMPESTADWMKKRKLIIKAGLETLNPQAAAQRYLEYFQKEDISIKNKIVLLFGYGGNITTACELLQAGAAKVIACEREGFPYPVFAEQIQQAYPRYFIRTQNMLQPDSNFIQIVHADIRQAADEQNLEKADVVFSSSVFEHLDDVEGITSALSRLTKPQGKHLHFVDLRDHYFKYPFEMLTFSSGAWQHWLNPTSNLNRYRIPHYQAIFEKYFASVTIKTIESNPEEFRKVKAHIREEYRSGEESIDAATIITITAVA